MSEKNTQKDRGKRKTRKNETLQIKNNEKKLNTK